MTTEAIFFNLKMNDVKVNLAFFLFVYFLISITETRVRIFLPRAELHWTGAWTGALVFQSKFKTKTIFIEKSRLLHKDSKNLDKFRSPQLN